MAYIIKFFSWLFLGSETKYDSVIDSKILFSVMLLLGFGIIMVYSASVAYAYTSSHSQYYFLIRHIGSIIIGSVVFVLVFSQPTDLIEKNAIKITLFIIIMLALVLVPHVGKVVNGSRRWIGIGSLGIQPSELSKLGLVVYLSYYLSDRVLQLRHFVRDFVPILLVMGIFMGLLLLEPDMGTSTVIFIISLSMFYLSDTSRKFIVGMTLIGVVGFIVLVTIEPYRVRRFLGFMDPWSDALGKGYQLTHSLLAIGHGGWLGVGVGNSVEKLFYLPEAYTDFILAILAEETGVAGVLIVLLLFWIIFYRGIMIIGNTAKSLPNRKFQAFLAYGISVWFLVQAIINMGVTLGILPTKGLTLPFISYGGSSIVINFIALAILLRVDYENKLMKQKGGYDK